MARTVYGHGTITELEKGKKYRLRLSCGRKDPKTGRYPCATETFFGTRRQAELRIEEMRREITEGITAKASNMTVGEWLDSYIEQREQMGKCRPGTLKRDRDLGKHIREGIGNIGLTDLAPADIESFYATMKADGIGDTTVHQCHRLLKTVMKKAVNNDLILRNPVDRVEPPKKPVPDRQSLSVSDAKKLAALCTSGEPTANKTAVYLALATGARLGEVLGLTWGNVDMRSERPAIRLIQQYTDRKTLAPLKTDKDDNPVGRIVPIDRSTVAALASWSQVQREQLNALGIEQSACTPVISNQVGGFTSHTRFERWWRDFCVANGFGKLVSAEDGREVVTLTLGDNPAFYPGCVIEWKDAEGWPCDESGKRYSRSNPRPKIRTRYKGLHFHTLRHTHFSLRLASGTDLKTAQYLGGWSSPAMLMNIYAHPVSQNIWNSAGFMDDLTTAPKEPAKTIWSPFGQKEGGR